MNSVATGVASHATLLQKMSYKPQPEKPKKTYHLCEGPKKRPAPCRSAGGGARRNAKRGNRPCLATHHTGFTKSAARPKRKNANTQRSENQQDTLSRAVIIAQIFILWNPTSCSDGLPRLCSRSSDLSIRDDRSRTADANARMSRKADCNRDPLAPSSAVAPTTYRDARS